MEGTGPAGKIIGEALRLGIMARPCHSKRVGVGGGLEVSETCFWIVSGQFRAIWHPEPSDLMLDWELTTRDLIEAERAKEEGLPW